VSSTLAPPHPACSPPPPPPSPTAHVPPRRHCALLSARPRSTVDPSCSARSTRRGPGLSIFPLENKSEKSIIPYHFAFRPLSFCKFCRGPGMFEKITAVPSVSKKYLRLGPSHSKYPKNSPKNTQKIPTLLKSPIFCAKTLRPLPKFQKNPRTLLKGPFCP
jgi:hypothetical protein